MKILSTEQIREADKYTIKNEPISSINLMERAAGRCFLWFERNLIPGNRLVFFCGTGNNGGDGLAIARMMRQNDRNRQILVYVAGDPEKGSEDFRVNYKRLQDLGMKPETLTEEDSLPAIDAVEDVVIDALFGSGLGRPLEGIHAGIVHHLNASGAVIVSIDVPSGLFIDKTATSEKQTIIHADYTLTFSPPKMAFLFPENEIYTGRWEILDIGISRDFINDTPSLNYYLTAPEVADILKTRKKFSHKGNFGHALLITGSRGKMGAAVLAARACLRTGAGLVTSHIPASGNDILQIAVPETMVEPDHDENILSEIHDLTPYTAIGAGPGLGMAEQTAKTLKFLIQNAGRPLVLDADALNILGENKTWLSFLPAGSILTPHPKEFERIAWKTENDFERNERQRELSQKHGIYIVLKGAHTAITTPEGKCYFNSTGNPGMATGGSGDVLTGIITGMMAQ
ncbi:MAG: NAD(P)H-hydrate dehydratase, partial [Syntrophothermus sp.]